MTNYPDKPNQSDEIKYVLIEDLPMEQQQKRIFDASISDGYDSEEAAYRAHMWESF